MDYRSILTRSALVSSINSMNLLGLVPPEVRAAYELLTSEFNPLELCKKLDPLLASLEVRVRKNKTILWRGLRSICQDKPRCKESLIHCVNLSKISWTLCWQASRCGCSTAAGTRVHICFWTLCLSCSRYPAVSAALGWRAGACRRWLLLTVAMDSDCCGCSCDWHAYLWREDLKLLVYWSNCQVQATYKPRCVLLSCRASPAP
jgi:hypothetical protein